jgi:prepilin signal peptidase PulO-like enzyme (type II secretory pathway)
MNGLFTILSPILLGLSGLAVAFVTDNRRTRWLGIADGGELREDVWYAVFGSLGFGLGFIFMWGQMDAASLLASIALLLTSAYDLRYRLVFPTLIGVLLVALGIVQVIADPSGSALRSSVAGAVVLGLLVLFLYLLAAALYGTGALGGGDVFIGILIGAALGWPLAILGILVGAFLGGFVAFGFLLAGAGRRAYIPYGAMLCLGAAFTLAARWIWYAIPYAAQWLNNLELLMRLMERSLLG